MPAGGRGVARPVLEELFLLTIRIDSRSAEPAYRQVKRQIVERIESGALAAGTRVPSVRALSRQTGLSCGTVARAVAELTREDYLSGRGRRGLAVVERTNICIGITGTFRERMLFTDPYYQRILAGIDDVLQARHFALTFRSASEPMDRTFDGFRVDGVLTLGAGVVETRRDALIRWNARTPVMAIGAWLAPDERLSYVISDSVGDARRAVACLLRAGRRPVAAVFHSRASLRMEGYRQALAGAGAPWDERLVVVRDESAALEADLERVAGRRPAAVFDSIGNVWPRLAACWPAAAPPPAVATYRDDPLEWARAAMPHVIVRQPLREMGAAAAERLLGLIARRDRRVVQVVMPSEIVDCLAAPAAVTSAMGRETTPTGSAGP